MSREDRHQTGGLPWLPPEDDDDPFAGGAGHAFGPPRGFRRPGAGADPGEVNGFGGNGNGAGAPGGYGPPGGNLAPGNGYAPPGDGYTPGGPGPGGQAPGQGWDEGGYGGGYGPQAQPPGGPVFGRPAPAFGPNGYDAPPAFDDRGSRAPVFGSGPAEPGSGWEPPSFGNPGNGHASTQDAYQDPPGQGFGAANGRPPAQDPGAHSVFDAPAFGNGRPLAPGAGPWGAPQAPAPTSRAERFRDQWEPSDPAPADPDPYDQRDPYAERGQFGRPAPAEASPWAPGPEQGRQVFGDDQLWWDGDAPQSAPDPWGTSGTIEANPAAPAAWPGFGTPPSEPDASTTAGADAVRPSRAERLRAPDAQARGGYKGNRERRVWPRRVAILVAIAVVMVVSWYWVFPWLDSVMPAEF